MAKFLTALIVLLVGASFASLLILLDALPILVRISAAAAVCIAAIVFLKMVREALSTLRSGQSWRVEITDHTLIWASPVPEIMASFEIALNDIEKSRRVMTVKKNSKVSPKNQYFLDLKDGSSLEISDQLSAIPPRKVFQALADVEIEFIESTERSGPTVGFISSSGEF